MKARRFEEVLEECLSALYEGRRTLAECLSLYPSLASQLEPLLETAADITHAFDINSPPHHVLERGRDRFLTAASTRARARALTERITSDHRSRPWGVRLWATVGMATAGTVAAAVIGLAVFAGVGGGESTVSGPGPDTPAAVLDFSQVDLAHQQLREAASTGGAVEPATIKVLKDAVEAWQHVEVSTLPAAQRQELEQKAVKQAELLQTISETQPAPQSGDILVVLGSTQDVLKKLGVELPPPPTPVAAPTPAPATPVPTAPAETPTPTLPPAPTPPPTPAETPAPTPVPGGGETTPTPPIFQPS